MELFLAGVILTLIASTALAIVGTQKGWVSSLYERFSNTLRVRSGRYTKILLADVRRVIGQLAEVADRHCDIETVQNLHRHLDFGTTQALASQYMRAASDLIEQASELAEIYQSVASALIAGGSRTQSKSAGNAGFGGFGGSSYSARSAATGGYGRQSATYSQSPSVQSEVRFDEDESYFYYADGDEKGTLKSGKVLNDKLDKGFVFGRDFYAVPGKCASA